MREPKLTADERAGLPDFRDTYRANYDEIRAAAVGAARSVPAFSALIEAQGPEGVSALFSRSRELLFRALDHDEWAPYLDNLRQSGEQLARSGVPFGGWFPLLSAYEQVLIPKLIALAAGDGGRLTRSLLASHRFVEIGLAEIGSAYVDAKEAQIAQQQRALLELSTPVLQVRERMLILPIIGVLDTRRARQLTEQLLNAIRQARAKMVVIDITGVPAVDSKVANHLLQTVAAARLMGAQVVVSGVSPEVAQALVMLGVDLDRLQTVGDLQGGIELAETMLGYRVVAGPAPLPSQQP